MRNEKNKPLILAENAWLYTGLVDRWRDQFEGRASSELLDLLATGLAQRLDADIHLEEETADLDDLFWTLVWTILRSNGILLEGSFEEELFLLESQMEIEELIEISRATPLLFSKVEEWEDPQWEKAQGLFSESQQTKPFSDHFFQTAEAVEALYQKATAKGGYDTFLEEMMDYLDDLYAQIDPVSLKKAERKEAFDLLKIPGGEPYVDALYTLFLIQTRMGDVEGALETGLLLLEFNEQDAFHVHELLFPLSALAGDSDLFDDLEEEYAEDTSLTLAVGRAYGHFVLGNREDAVLLLREIHKANSHVVEVLIKKGPPSWIPGPVVRGSVEEAELVKVVTGIFWNQDEEARRFLKKTFGLRPAIDEKQGNVIPFPSRD